MKTAKRYKLTLMAVVTRQGRPDVIKLDDLCERYVYSGAQSGSDGAINET